jgi:hypothetical protein
MHTLTIAVRKHVRLEVGMGVELIHLRLFELAPACGIRSQSSRIHPQTDPLSTQITTGSGGCILRPAETKS